MSPYHRNVFESLPQEHRQRRAEELASYLSKRLASSDDFETEVERIVASLRDQGHELWSWDEDVNRQVWGPDYQQSRMTGLLIEFEAPSSVAVEWKDNVDGGDVRRVFGGSL